jgi:hypothetical protein
MMNPSGDHKVIRSCFPTKINNIGFAVDADM